MGPKVMSLGFTVLSSLDLRDVASPYLEKLAKESNQNVNLGILDGVDVVYIDRIKKWQILDTNVHVGSRLNSYQTAIGRAILAFLNEEEFKSVLSRLLKDATIKGHIGEKGKNLTKILERVRQKGYAVNDEELIKGLRSIAAPIFNAQSEVEGAINIPVFTQMVNRSDLIERFVPLLLDTAEKISCARGFIKEKK
jgi:IclR family pca regulon transcriptional regulator